MLLELVTGEESDGRFALHSCDNPPCVNPAHLRWGSHADNMTDAADRGRIRNQWSRRKETNGNDHH